ncbi:MAG: hypothetical protein Kow0031_08530 [Anaerolineae bacterium]
MDLIPPIELVNNVALLLALTLLYDLTLQDRRSQRLGARLLYGVAIGAFGIAVMVTAWPLVPGIVFDTRSILLALSGLFFGTVPTVVAMVITAIFRWYQGGAGAWAGISVILASGLLGLGWRHLRRHKTEAIPWLHLYLFGFLVHLVMLLLMWLMLPYPTSITVLTRITFPVLILYPIGTVLLGMLLQRQQERERTREALLDREERLQLALDAAGMRTWDWDIANSNIVWDMPGSTENGREKTTATYHDAIEFIHPADREAVVQAVAGAIRAKKRYQQDFRLVEADGSVRWATAYGQVLDRPGGRQRCIGIVKDITSQRQADAALRLSRFAVDNAAEGMVVVAHDGRLADVNREECRRLGYSREELLQKYVWDVDPAMTPEDWPAHWQRIQDSGQLIFQTTNLTRDGEEIYLEISVAYIEFEGQEYYYAFSRDITRQRQMELQLRQAQKMEAMGRLAGSIAHDFNNLLVPITGFAEMAAALTPKDTQLGQYLVRINDSANLAAALTRQILTFSRSEILELQVVDFNQVVSGFREMMPSLVRQNIRVAFNLAAEPLLVDADVSRLEQILLNLVVNGSDAMPGGGELTISTAAVCLDDPWQTGFTRLEPGEYVLLTVTDTGEGIPPENLDHIFEPFFTTRAAGKGTGLGLATVHGIILQHQGDVLVSSRPGNGASFMVALPRCDSLPPEAPQPQLPPPAKHDPTQATVLIAEDDENVRYLLRETLLGLGCRVLEAAGGLEAEALVEAATGPVDLLVSDFAMPYMNGLELFQRLQQRYPHLRVLFISGHAEESLAAKEISRQGYAFLPKPFPIAELSRTVEKILAGN